MWNDTHNAYLESRVLSAEPVELVVLLYQACSDSIREARRHLANGKVAERSREISRALAILTELTVSLDRERGGELGIRLAQLYDYLQQRLIAANVDQSDAPLAEALGLLSTLSEAWAGVAQQRRQPAPAVERWTPPAGEAALSPEAHAWSF